MTSAIASPIEIEIRLLLEAIYLRFHYDFRSYSMVSLKRRIGVALPQLGCATVSALQEKILHDPQKFSELLQYLTVQVSEMFRDPTFYKTFRDEIIPQLKTYPSLKLWVAGCSTGEEVYSLAITLREEGLLERTILYATDINPDALAKAEAGMYALDRLAAFSENHRQAGGSGSLSEYYTARYGNAVFDRSLRKNIVFSDHSLATDNVFAEVQVVTCRNVLIYFDRELQTRRVRALSEHALSSRIFGIGLARDAAIFVARVRVHRGITARSVVSAMLSSDLTQLSSRRFRAIAIGASSGGIEALTALLPVFTDDFPIPVFVVIHLPQDRPSLLVELFARKCALVVREAYDKQEVSAGIWFASPGYHLMIDSNRCFALSVDDPVNYSRPSVDVLFQTAAEVYGRGLLGIVLTGANNDGANGAKAIAENGGAVLAQDPAEAEANMMPSAALSAVATAIAAPLSRIADVLRGLTVGATS